MYIYIYNFAIGIDHLVNVWPMMSTNSTLLSNSNMLWMNLAQQLLHFFTGIIPFVDRQMWKTQIIFREIIAFLHLNHRLSVYLVKPVECLGGFDPLINPQIETTNESEVTCLEMPKIILSSWENPSNQIWSNMIKIYGGFLKCTPISSILVGFSLISHPFLGSPVRKPPIWGSFRREIWASSRKSANASRPMTWPVASGHPPNHHKITVKSINSLFFWMVWT